eukprot:TRINITY_DN8075_c0_g1_i1.p1 TRINITY_DN8075_c0_g1~~TRINITY_DN8075_c0_g1_i1.p1  ORF type:complete len:175 (+),score=22.71 TRINITY_DN8075_c0_g1_i1:143-667(+)
MATSNGRTVHVTHSLKSGYGVNNGQCTVSQFIRAGQAERPAPDHSVYQRMQHLPQFKGSFDLENHGQGPSAWTTTTGVSYAQQSQPQNDCERVIFSSQEHSRFNNSCAAFKNTRASPQQRPNSASMRTANPVLNENDGMGPGEWSTTAGTAYPSTHTARVHKYYSGWSRSIDRF